LLDDEDVRAVVLYGGERCFAAGADINQLAAMSFEQITGWNRAMQRTLTSYAELPMPVIAAVTGYALGGGLELALAADYRVASDNVVLGLPEVQLGIMPGSGGTQRLTRLIGPSRAKELLMTGRHVLAAEALSSGIVDRLVPAAEVYDAALDYAQQLARGPRLAIQAIKEAVDRGADGSSETGLALERALIAGLFATQDRDTGMESFLRDGPGKARFGPPETSTT
jgi:enoyl-CoA hydratase/carnithine racemase